MASTCQPKEPFSGAGAGPAGLAAALHAAQAGEPAKPEALFAASLRAFALEEVPRSPGATIALLRREIGALPTGGLRLRLVPVPPGERNASRLTPATSSERDEQSRRQDETQSRSSLHP